MFATVLVCCFQIKELLPQVLDVRLQARRLGGHSLVDFINRAENEPTNDVRLRVS